ncbi:MAG TPA: acyloxyacyl hydrolase [Gammaproteobacteria bacterium]|nr:acyloxyacyl hydrolase [Gammaproteobacteria bacterium]
MKRTFCLWGWDLSIFILALGILAPARANLGGSVSVGKGFHVEHVEAIRAALNWDFGILFLQDKPWGLNVHWESAAAFWQGHSTLTRFNDDLYLLTSGPVFRLQRRASVMGVVPYGEIGVSPSWLTQREISQRKLSIHFQFEDKIGFGFRFGKNQKIDLGYRFIHYSNASIKRPNSGVNIQMVNLGLWFS